MSWLFSFFKKEPGLTRQEEQILKEFQKEISYKFKSLPLLKRALSHKSYANEKRKAHTEQNERYEFLGDAVLELAVSHMMMKLFPNYTEGDLSKLRAALVNETSLADLARQINLGNYLLLGRGEDQCGGRDKDSLLSDAYEAVLGAIYLDSDFQAVYKIIHDQFEPLMKEAMEGDIIRDYKTRLQEESQDRFRSIPRYQLVAADGPDHDKEFEVHLHIRDKLYGRGRGKSKKQAEQNAARETLEKLEAI